MPTGNRVKPIVITTTPDTSAGMNLRNCGMKYPSTIWNRPPIREAPKTATMVAPLLMAAEGS